MMSESDFKERDAEICRLYLEGVSLHKLGKRFKISHERVRQVLTNNSVSTRAQGNPESLKMPKNFGRLTARERFMKKVDVVPDPVAGEHWLWKGTLILGKYGRFRMGGLGVYAHRAAFYLANGRFPQRLVNTCKVATCVQVEHWEEK